MPVKDYYKILEIPPDAAPQDIKKPGAALPGYTILTKTAPDGLPHLTFTNYRKPTKYCRTTDGVRGMTRKDGWTATHGKSSRNLLRRQWLFGESLKLSSHMAKVDTYRMSHAALHDYVFLLLSDAHMAILQQADNADINHRIVRELLKAVQWIEYAYMKNIAARLALLAADDESVLQQIHTAEEHSRRQAKWEKYKPFVMIGIALLLCALMYMYARVAAR